MIAESLSQSTWHLGWARVDSGKVDVTSGPDLDSVVDIMR